MVTPGGGVAPWSAPASPRVSRTPSRKIGITGSRAPCDCARGGNAAENGGVVPIVFDFGACDAWSQWCPECGVGATWPTEASSAAFGSKWMTSSPASTMAKVLSVNIDATGSDRKCASR
eukprot:scaffold42301_cov27-Tisochrysis_lutea.AAC.2